MRIKEQETRQTLHEHDDDDDDDQLLEWSRNLAHFIYPTEEVGSGGRSCGPEAPGSILDRDTEYRDRGFREFWLIY